MVDELLFVRVIRDEETRRVNRFVLRFRGDREAAVSDQASIDVFAQRWNCEDPPKAQEPRVLARLIAEEIKRQKERD